jgi:predicted SPOUT superfamily RNA methylase MTH1
LTLLSKKVAVSIPDTVLEEKDSLRDKTAKLGQIARACAIYGVDLIEVFKDSLGKGERADIVKVLEYLETPQYLRRRLYPLDESLRFAGVLPPLRIPSHKPRVAPERITPGEVREGVAEADGTVDIGLEMRPKLAKKAQAGKRITIRITSLRPLTAETISRDDVGSYWGYSVETKSAREVFSDSRFSVKVATSRLGDPLIGKFDELRSSIRSRGGVKLIFGSPSRGLFDIMGKELGSLADFVLNLFPDQHVETVRTEEAIFAGLELVSFLMADKA